MSRLLATLRWRHLRWAACAAVIPALWACNARKLVPPVPATNQVVQNKFQQSINRDLDILFMVDNSLSMAPLQTKMAAQLPVFMNVLKGLPGGQPNLHVAVVSSSLGAGIWGNVNGCTPGGPGNQGGAFLHNTAACPQIGLAPTEHFLSSVSNGAGGLSNNFTGDIAAAFSCIALLGQDGCGFEHQFMSTMVALQKANQENIGQAADPDNGGFLRPKAFLAVVMLTNEDDCSVPQDMNTGKLLDPGVESITDVSPPFPPGLGGLQSYRCNEFGHLCDGAAPPHTVTGRVTLNNCTSSEGKSPGDAAHQLITVESVVAFLKGLKPDNPDRVLVAAIAGPVTPYIVEPHAFQLGSGTTETQPWMVHSCTSGNAGTEYADPGVRIKNFLDLFGTNGVFEPICANDFGPSMMAIATAIGKRLGAQCISGTVLPSPSDPNVPDCDVALKSFDAATGKAQPDMRVPFCDSNTGNVGNSPCWRFVADATQCPMAAGVPNNRLEVCYDTGCTAAARPMNDTNAAVSCSLCPSGTDNPVTGARCP